VQCRILVPFLNLLEARHNDIENMQKRKLGRICDQRRGLPPRPSSTACSTTPKSSP
jgi:hypothetical protein